MNFFQFLCWEAHVRLLLEHCNAGAEERRLYTSLERPMPDYALEHVFSRYGAIEFVRLQSDPRHGVVQFAAAEAAAAALAGLTGTDICGQVRC